MIPLNIDIMIDDYDYEQEYDSPLPRDTIGLTPPPSVRIRMKLITNYDSEHHVPSVTELEFNAQLSTPYNVRVATEQELEFARGFNTLTRTVFPEEVS